MVVEVPRQTVVGSVRDLIAAVFGRDVDGDPSAAGVLCPTNKAADVINDTVLRLMPGQAREYFSEDKYHGSDGDDFVPPLELLNSVSSGSLPPHRLALKVGAVVMLLRNIDLEGGLCNGTRLKVVALLEHVVDCEVLTGAHRGTQCLIPRVAITSRDTPLPKPMTRLQFPLRVAYGMTINKSQGQTFAKVGLYLSKPCFAHGQLYVACSRVSCIQHLTVYVEPGTSQGTMTSNAEDMYTTNVVYSSIVDRDSEFRAEDVAPIYGVRQ